MDWPVGPLEDRAVAINGLPKGWYNATPFMAKYRINEQGELTLHTGADLNLPRNADFHTDVVAVKNGIVTCARSLGGSWGNVIVIRHDGFYSRYGHIEKMVVKVGDVVTEGQKIASVGDGNGYYHGVYAHLHFDISLTSILDASPGHWPGLNSAVLLANYTDPIKFIISQKQKEPPEPQEEDVDIKQYVVNNPPGVNLRIWYDVKERIIELISDRAVLDGYDETVVRGGYAWRLFKRGADYGWAQDRFFKPFVSTPPTPPPPVVDTILDMYHSNNIASNMEVAGYAAAIFHKATQGLTFVDPEFATRRAFFADKLPFGATHFGTGADPVKQADHFLDVVKPDGKTPLALDVETNRGESLEAEGSMTPAQALAFCARIRLRTGKDCLIYTRASYWVNAPLTRPTNPLWISNANNPPTIPAQWDTWAIQQYAVKPAPGMTGDVDHDRFRGTPEQFKAFLVTVSGTLIVEPPVDITEKLYVDVDELRLRQDVAVKDGPFYARGTAVEVNGDPIADGDYLWVHVVGPAPISGWMARRNTKTGEVYLVSTPPYVPPAMPSKLSLLGLHSYGNGGGLVLQMAKELADAKTPLAGVTVFRQGWGGELSPTQIKAVSPSTIVVERWAPNAQDASSLLQQAGIVLDWRLDDLYEVGKSAMSLYTRHFAIDSAADAMQIINEPVVVNAKGTCSFWQGAMDVAKALGLHLAVLCTPNWWPALPTETNAGRNNDNADLKFWTAPETAALVRRIIAERHYLTLHEYRFPDPGGVFGALPMGRTELGIAYLPEDCRKVPVILTEWGTFTGREMSSEEYIAGVTAGELATRRGEMNVKAIVAWVFGDYWESGHSSDISGHSAAILKYIKTAKF